MAIQDTIMLTPEGRDRLTEELQRLRDEDLPNLQRRVRELGEAGDISDDSDIEITKDELIQLENRIRDIEWMLEEAEIVEHQDGGEIVEFGSTVSVVDDEGETETWVIVGPHESDAAEGRISNVSPVGAALIGKRVGDKISVDAPAGEIVYEITDVQ
ncbi:MAG: transcription elongation factor GreA [Thermomicrobiales bacterium]